MKKFVLFLGLVALAQACVPVKKYNELLEKEKACSEELAKYKTDALNYEGQAKDLESRYVIAQKELAALKNDTSELGTKYRLLEVQYDKTFSQLAALESAYEKFSKSSSKETSSLQSELESKILELKRKEEALSAMETELNAKQQQLTEREQRVNELEEMIRRQEATSKALRDKVAAALKGFESQGLTVVNKNGKIYVSMEAKLLFASGSIVVEPNGKKALVELAKVLENEKDLEIIVEGHTDTDKLTSASHPKNNWELSVLRSTSVIEILLANSKMNPKQLMAGGRSEFMPVDATDKAKNRRIEIIISPNLAELYEIIGKD